jgi:hypothetical protein
VISWRFWMRWMRQQERGKWNRIYHRYHSTTPINKNFKDEYKTTRNNNIFWFHSHL